MVHKYHRSVCREVGRWIISKLVVFERVCLHIFKRAGHRDLLYMVFSVKMHWHILGTAGTS